MRDINELLEMLYDVVMENGRYVITDDMDSELREICEKTNAGRDERDKVLAERRIKRFMKLQE